MHIKSSAYQMRRIKSKAGIVPAEKNTGFMPVMNTSSQCQLSLRESDNAAK
jgi:hypothetical protein